MSSRGISGVALLLFLLAGSPPPVAAQVNGGVGKVWLKSVTPGPLIALDSRRHRLVSLATEDGSGNPDFSKVHVLALSPGSTWQALPVLGQAPPNVRGRVACYDAANDRVIVQGGHDSILVDPDPWTHYTVTQTEASTWALSLSGTPEWTRLDDLALEGAMVAADSADGDVILHGGYYDSTDPFATSHVHSVATWRLTAAGHWQKVASGLEPPYVDITPGDQSHELAAYDPDLLLFYALRAEPGLVAGGPAVARSLYTLDPGAVTWTESPISGSAPPDTIYRIGFDAVTRTLLAFSGDEVYSLAVDAAPAWQSVPTTGGAGRTVRAWDPGSRSAFAYEKGGPADRLDAGSSLAWSAFAPAETNTYRSPGLFLQAAVCDSVSGTTYVLAGSRGWQGFTLYPPGTPYSVVGGTGTMLSLDAAEGGLLPVAGASLPSRYFAGLALDPARRRLVAYGGMGIEYTSEDCVGDTAHAPHYASEPLSDRPYRDLYAWPLDSNGPWTPVPFAGPAPGCRAVLASGFDAVADRALFVGDGAPQVLAVSLAGDSASWQEIPVAGAPPGPWPCTSSWAWDAVRRRFWVLDPGTMALSTISCESGATWEAVATAGAPPATASTCAITLDTERDRLLVLVNDPAQWLWEIPLAGPEWRTLPVSGDAPIVEACPTFSYDPTRTRAILYGGAATSPTGGAWDIPTSTRVSDSLFVVQFDSPTAVSASLVAQDASPGRVRLLWQIADAAGAVLAAERSSDGVAWTALGTLVPDAGGRVELVDESVAPGTRWAYRLRGIEGGDARTIALVWVRVPEGFALRLDGARPNPVRGPLRLSFALADASPATLEVLDVQGRSCARTDVGALGAGEHVLALAPERPLAPGLYFARLVTTRGVRLARLTVVK